ncbi:S1 family peptidase [Salininema proteolyticum]|uniref:S1 family peptidase n=1 Tax=Salininema proteolyticum TaxID=1607685 RepID=A0ABV8TW05_9ACTN
MSRFIERSRIRLWSTAVLAGLLALVLVPSTASAESRQADSGENGFIVGGDISHERYQFLAAVLYADSDGRLVQGCGAALVTDQWLVTAAHCLGGITAVRLGSNDRTSGGAVVPVEREVSHPLYHQYTSANDIAMLKLAYPVDFASVAIAANEPAAGTDVRLLGWGQTCPVKKCDRGSDDLKQLDTSIADDAHCGGMNPDELCTRSRPDATACYGDSGGPAVIDRGGWWLLVGVTSRGSQSCGDSGTVYSSVTGHYDWMDQVVSWY